MPLKSKNNLIIKSKIIFSVPHEWDINQVNRLVIHAFENVSLLTYYDQSSSVPPSASLVLTFQNWSIINSTPTNWEKFVGLIYRNIPRKNNDKIKNEGFFAYKRALTYGINENPFKFVISLKLNPKSDNQKHVFEGEITLYPIIYQKVHQKFVNLNSICDDNFLSQMLSQNSDLINQFSSGIGGQIIEKPHYDETREERQIFISHSQKDESLKAIIEKTSSASHIKAIYEEYERLLHGQITKEKIISDIEESDAIFVLLSENVNNLTNTRDWVAFESGYSSAQKKDVWVFELIGARDKISFITPGVTDYFPFHLNDETFLKYLAKVMKSYDYVYIPTKLLGFPFKCEKCQSKYQIHCPEDYSFPKNSLKCPVCNEIIRTEITPLSKVV